MCKYIPVHVYTAICPNARTTCVVCTFKLLQHLNNYCFVQDLLYTCRTFENGEEIRRIYLLHALNHVLKYVG